MVAFKNAPAPSRVHVPEAADAPRMRLVRDEDFEDSDRPLRVPALHDRRAHPRQALSLRVSGRRLDHSVDARREPFLHLAMSDVSVGGLSALSQTPLAIGERVAVFFPPQGSGRGWDAYGRVLRVTAEKQGYRLAVCFDPLRAA